MSNAQDFKTILVLDDDPHFHKLVVPVLNSRGHKVLSADQGREALEILDGEPTVDLIVVDGQLPDTTGIDWIADVRKRGCKSLVIFISAYWRDAKSYHTLTKELGVSLVLHKPVLASVFASEVDLLLGKTALPQTQAHTNVEDTLLALRAEYASELPSVLAELAMLIERCKTEKDNLTLLTEARTLAHKLRGTAASYGFPEIGQLAATIEDRIVIALEGDEAGLLGSIASSVQAARDLGSKAAAELETPSARPLAAEGLQSDSQKGAAMARILVVDDDAAFLDLVAELAEEHQLETISSRTAFDALEKACLTEVDAALIDVELGSRDAAFKLASDLRSLPGYEHLPMGFVSGAGHIERLQEGEKLGPCFYFERPKEAGALQAVLRQLSAIKQATKPKILIVDDDPDFLKRTAFVLQHEGMAVHTLQDTSDILQTMHRLVPDLVLLDVMMPGVSGFDICRMLRTMPRWRDLPVLFLTAYADIDTRVASVKCGGDDYLLKPVVNEELLVNLQMCLERSRLLKQRLERDNVSGLLDRRVAMEELAAMLGEAKRQNWSAVVCLLEISAEGSDVAPPDSMVATLGNLLMRKLRPEDLRGRLDTTKMITAFRNESKAAVQQLMNRVMDEYATLAQHVNDDEPGRKVEFALACYPDDGNSLHELLHSAYESLHLESRTRTKTKK